MNSEATREVLWNVNSLTTVVGMYGLMVISLIIAGAGVFSRFKIWSSGQPSPDHTGLWHKRLWDLITWGFFQRGVLRRIKPGVTHFFIFTGFLVLLFTTTMVFIHHDLKIEIYKGTFYLALTVLSDLFGLGVLVGCALMAYRRYVAREDLLHTRAADAVLLGSLALLIVQGFLLEGLRIHVTNDPWRNYSPVGDAVASFFWPLSSDAARLLHKLTWWFHTVTVFAVVAIVPYSKYFHLVTSPLSLFFKRSKRPKGALESPGDLMTLMETQEDLKLGLGTIKDYSWKQLIELDACTSCGRCQDACPAYLSGKPLSPKWVILDTRNHLLALHSRNKLGNGSPLPAAAQSFDRTLTENFLVKPSGVNPSEDNSGFEAAGEYRGANENVQQAVLSLGRSADDRIAGDVMDPNVFWSCTTCMACVNACPVGINHVDQIIGNRRNLALIQGEIPNEAQMTLRSLENRGNPYGPAEDRVKWLDGIDVRILQPGDKVDYLYWVGCVSAYDPRKQKIARALTKLMKAAGLSFGILGSSEGCTGDPARRLGEENIFQNLAKSNLEVLKSVSFSTLVANCPHCFNTIKNEYPQFGNLGDGRSPEIVHHTQLLKRLIAEGKLKLNEADLEVTLHDPCYLSRYNDEVEAPRQSLRGVKGLRIVEMERSKDKNLCCGAGGGHFWMDLKIGTRVNAIRVDEAAATGVKEIATACPFCLQMLEDGTKITNRENELSVRDIAEILADHIN